MPSAALRQLMAPIWRADLNQLSKLPSSELNDLQRGCRHARLHLQREFTELGRNIWRAAALWGGLATSGGGLLALVLGSEASNVVGMIGTISTIGGFGIGVAGYGLQVRDTDEKAILIAWQRDITRLEQSLFECYRRS